MAVMKRNARIAAAIVLMAIVASHVGAQQAELERLRKELIDTEIALEKFRYRIPPCGGPSDLAESAANHAKVEAVDGSEPVAGAPLRLRRLDISGRSAFADAHQLLHRIAMQSEYRTLDVESLNVTAEDGENVRFWARIAEVCWSDEAPPAATTPMPRTPEAMYRRKLDELKATMSAVTQLDERMRPLRVVDWLGELDAQWGDHAVLLGELHYAAPQLTVKGIALGSAARKAIEHTAEVKWAAAGDCRAFTATARVPARDFEEHHLAGRVPFDERTATLCGSSAPAQVKIAVPRGSGNLTLHARGIELPNLFRVLHDLDPSDGYVVAPGLAGRIDADIESATIGEVLDAIRAATGAFISPGPLHRVCKSDCGASKQTYKGEPLSMMLGDAEVGDVAQAIAGATQTDVRVPGDPRARIAIFASERPWDQLLEAMIAVVGQTKAVASSRRGLAVWDVKKLGVDDVRLAVVARAGGESKAWAHALGSSSLLLALEPGAELFDGSVVSVGDGKVRLRTSAGRELDVPLQ